MVTTGPRALQAIVADLEHSSMDKQLDKMQALQLAQFLSLVPSSSLGTAKEILAAFNQQNRDDLTKIAAAQQAANGWRQEYTVHD